MTENRANRPDNGQKHTSRWKVFSRRILGSATAVSLLFTGCSTKGVQEYSSWDDMATGIAQKMPARGDDAASALRLSVEIPTVLGGSGKEYSLCPLMKAKNEKTGEEEMRLVVSKSFADYAGLTAGPQIKKTVRVLVSDSGQNEVVYTGQWVTEGDWVYSVISPATPTKTSSKSKRTPTPIATSADALIQRAVANGFITPLEYVSDKVTDGEVFVAYIPGDGYDKITASVTAGEDPTYSAEKPLPPGSAVRETTTDRAVTSDVAFIAVKNGSTGLLEMKTLPKDFITTTIGEGEEPKHQNPVSPTPDSKNIVVSSGSIRRGREAANRF